MRLVKPTTLGELKGVFRSISALLALTAELALLGLQCSTLTAENADETGDQSFGFSAFRTVAKTVLETDKRHFLSYIVTRQI